MFKTELSQAAAEQRQIQFSRPVAPNPGNAAENLRKEMLTSRDIAALSNTGRTFDENAALAKEQRSRDAAAQTAKLPTEHGARAQAAIGVTDATATSAGLKRDAEGKWVASDNTPFLRLAGTKGPLAGVRNQVIGWDEANDLSANLEQLRTAYGVAMSGANIPEGEKVSFANITGSNALTGTELANRLNKVESQMRSMIAPIQQPGAPAPGLPDLGFQP
jgi:hypothetical protein